MGRQAFVPCLHSSSSDADMTLVDVEVDVETEEPSETCEQCGERFTGKLARQQLGRHNWNKHGMRASDAKKATAAPKAAGSSGSGPTSPNAPITDGEIYAGLIELHILAQMLAGFKCAKCAETIGEIMEAASKAWMRLAKRSPEVRARLEAIARISFLGIMLAYLPFFAGIRDHHIAPAVERRRQAVAQRQARGPGAEDPARARYEEGLQRQADKAAESASEAA